MQITSEVSEKVAQTKLIISLKVFLIQGLIVFLQEFSCVKDSVAAIVLANNTMIHPANGPGRVLKLCFSIHKPPFNNTGLEEVSKDRW